MNTRQFATRLGNQPQSIHASFCRKGHYLGIVPAKLPNGTLLWPDDAVEQLIEMAKKTPPLDKCKQARAVKAEKRAAAEVASRIELDRLDDEEKGASSIDTHGVSQGGSA